MDLNAFQNDRVWLIELNDKKKGPFTAFEIQAFWDEGALIPQMKVIHQENPNETFFIKDFLKTLPKIETRSSVFENLDKDDAVTGLFDTLLVAKEQRELQNQKKYNSQTEDTQILTSTKISSKNANSSKKKLLLTFLGLLIAGLVLARVFSENPKKNVKQEAETLAAQAPEPTRPSTTSDESARKMISIPKSSRNRQQVEQKSQIPKPSIPPESQKQPPQPNNKPATTHQPKIDLMPAPNEHERPDYQNDRAYEEGNTYDPPQHEESDYYNPDDAPLPYGEDDVGYPETAPND